MPPFSWFLTIIWGTEASHPNSIGAWKKKDSAAITLPGIYNREQRIVVSFCRILQASQQNEKTTDSHGFIYHKHWDGVSEVSFIGTVVVAKSLYNNFQSIKDREIF